MNAPLSRTTYVPKTEELCLNHLWGCIIIKYWHKSLVIIKWLLECIFNILRELEPPRRRSHSIRRMCLPVMLKFRPLRSQEFSSRNSLNRTGLWEAFSQAKRVPLWRQSHTSREPRNSVTRGSKSARLCWRKEGSWHYFQFANNSFCESDTRQW
jgi:hypothetical protein